MREKLIELMCEAKRTDPKTGSFTEYLADYLLANGVVVLPCKVGDTVFVIPTQENGRKEITPMTCRGFYISLSGNSANCFDEKNKLYQPSSDRFGESVFLTMEEAETALEASNATP